MGNHAVLSASSSHRWINCPPSVRLTEHMSDSGSVYATEGSEAHALCEYKLRQALGQDAQNPLESPGGLQYYDNAMEDAATGYREAPSAPPVFYFICAFRRRSGCPGRPNPPACAPCPAPRIPPDPRPRGRRP